MWSDLTVRDWVPAMEIPSGEAEILAGAVRTNDFEKLKSLLDHLGTEKRVNFLHGPTLDNLPLLHYAALHGQIEMVNFLLSRGFNPLLTSRSGRTALHEAVRGGNPEATAALLRKVERDETDGLQPQRTVDLACSTIATLTQTGALINLKDQSGLTPLLFLSEIYNVPEQDFTALVKILVESGADVSLAHPASGQSALFRAVELKSMPSCQMLVEAGANIDHKDFAGETAVHVAAKFGFANLLKYLLQRSRKSLNERSLKGESPLHFAATSGSRQCLNILLDFGADLAIENNEEQSALEAICSNLPRPKAFLIQTLDSKIIPNQCSINDRQFELTLDFRILTPDRERQMSVLVAFLNALNSIDRKFVLQHPLIDTYLRFKWTKMKLFFFILVFIHVTFVVSLSAHIILLLYPDDKWAILCSRRVLLVTATLLMAHIMAQTFLAPKYFMREAETWLSSTCASCAFLMSVYGEIVPDTAHSEWIRHVASFTVLLSWCQVLFILGRFPSIGFFALMFFAVFKNVLKVLPIFACLVIGFSLSFCVQFNNFEYEGPWRSFIRTIVMMMGEYQYQDLFTENQEYAHRRWTDKPSNLQYTSQVIFLLFLILGSIVLINLLIGLAVNDIQGLQEEGNLKHMIKQAEFLQHMDRLMSYFPVLRGRKAIPSLVTFNPTTTNKMKESNFRRMGLNIPSHIIESLVKIALKNQSKDGAIMIPFARGSKNKRSVNFDLKEDKTAANC